MGVIEGLVGALVCILLVAFLLTGTLFFMEATVTLSKVGDMLKGAGVVAIPLGGKTKKPVTPTNSDPV